MIQELKFVRNAVATKDFVPTLTHFRICGGRVTGYNGELAISSPVAIDLDIAPKAGKFMQAINACEETVTLTMQKGRLLVRSGKFKTFVDCVDVDTVPVVVPTGRKVKLAGSLLGCFRTVEPFIGIDASKPWACGVLFKGQSAFATNNVIIVEHWMGADLPLVNIPSFAIKEVLRNGIEPDHMLIEDNRITFMYEDGKWISSPLSVLQWPAVDKALDQDMSKLTKFPETFFEGVEKLAKFGDELGRCYFKENLLTTSDKYEDEGATYACGGVPAEGCYNLKILASLKGVAEMIDFTAYPKPAPFCGGMVRGVMVGYRA